MAIIWEEKYSVGVSLIDEQHKQFVWILDKLSTAISKSDTKDVLAGILNDLDQYAVYHFILKKNILKSLIFLEQKSISRSMVSL